MKIHTLIIGTLMASTLAIFAEDITDQKITADKTIEEDSSWTAENQEIINSAILTVTNGATLTVNTGPMNAQNNSKIVVDAGATFNYTASNDFRLKNFASVDVSGTFKVGGTFKLSEVNNNFDQGSTLVVRSGAYFENGSAFELQSVSTATFEHGSTSVHKADFKVNASRDNQQANTVANLYGTTTISGAFRIGDVNNTSVTSNATMNIAQAANVTANELNLANNKTGINSTLNISGIGTTVRINNNVNLGDDGGKSTVILDITNGANLNFSALNFVKPNSNINFNIAEFDGADTAMVTARGSFNVAGGKINLLIDDLLSSAGATPGDEVTFSLIELDGGSFVGSNAAALAAMSDLDFATKMQNAFAFSFAGNDNWEAADYSNFKFENNTIVLKLIAAEAIPEPSTYAAIFGALALAFVAYRRRK